MPTASLIAQGESPIMNGNHENHYGDHEAKDFDLVCIGFGPASLAIAVALHDLAVPAKALFLERQPQFAWHAGMLLPGARMQISFLKDLATFRDPRSYFTFLNYLKCKNRLEAFTNLGTFLPLREEFNDYLTWAAGHFTDQVQYGAEVTSVAPAEANHNIVGSWHVTFQDRDSGHTSTVTAQHVVIALGGTPRLPRSLEQVGPRVVHSSQYLSAVSTLLPRLDPADTRLAVIGGGQSAAEIFDDLTSRYREANITLFTTASALRPSDDSPFVNEIFDPNVVSSFYDLNPEARNYTIAENRATNYSVVRTPLLEHLYEKLYQQRLHCPDEQAWPHKIATLSELQDVQTKADGRLSLTFSNPRSLAKTQVDGVDLVIVGTGYTRNAHEQILQKAKHLLSSTFGDVERNYRLKMMDGRVSPSCGIWLQGCCEASHGLSDSLLSILAVRGGELVKSIFGKGPLPNGNKKGISSNGIPAREPLNAINEQN